MDENIKSSYYSILPAVVRYDKDLTANAKLLYGEISALTQKNGICFATNEYFSRLYNLSERAITRLICSLKNKGYIKVEIKNDIDNKRTRQICLGGIDKNGVNPIDKFVQYNNTSISNINIIIVEQAIKYMNELAGTNFKPTSKKTQSLINARLKEGFDIEDLKDVIYCKYHEWFKNPVVFKNGVKSDTYYRPNTLFGTNFESYLEKYKKDYK